MDRDRPPHLIMTYQLCGNEAKGDVSKDSLTVNGIRTGHEA
jgi:hypothetical protein